MPTTSANGIEVYYDTFGDPGDPTLLMVSGLGAQCIGFQDDYCGRFADRGYRVVRYDNRDVGLSTRHDGVEFDALAAFAAGVGGEPVDAPYTLSDMAADGMGLLDALGVDRAHVMGCSMGGMIAQTMAIEFPDRVRSLASVFSTTGSPDVGLPHQEVLASLAEWVGSGVEPTSRDDRIESSMRISRVIATPTTWDEDVAREYHGRLVDRAWYPQGTPRQFGAIVASGSREDALRQLALPTAVLHCDADPLVDISGGRRTAELVPGAQFHQLDGMGHDLPEPYWDRIVDVVVENAGRAG
ncbi:MAG: alpha/beta fold hydrolase [Actinomycetes bacterium]